MTARMPSRVPTPTTEVQALDLLASLENNAARFAPADELDTAIVEVALESRRQIMLLNKVLQDPAFPVSDERRDEMRTRLDDATRIVLRDGFRLDVASIDEIINGPR